MKKKIAILVVVAVASIGAFKLVPSATAENFNYRVRLGTNGCTECARFELGAANCNPKNFMPICQ